MNGIKCLDNLLELKTMFENGEIGSSTYFSKRLNISKRSFLRLKDFLNRITDNSIKYDKSSRTYYSQVSFKKQAPCKSKK
jgi:hypothetical protein